MKIFLDDDLKHRNTPHFHYRFLSAESILKFFRQNHDVEIESISFDNDLGGYLEGYDVVKYMVNHHIIANQYNVHSANIIAQQNMVSYLKSGMKMGVIPKAPITIEANPQYQKRFQSGGNL